MTGLDKITSEILNEAAMDAKAVLAAAEAEAEAIFKAAYDEAEALNEKITAAAQKEAADILSSCNSALRLQQRQHMLQIKQELLSETLQAAQEELYKLPDAQYFSLLVKQAVRFSEPGKAEMLLNARDAARIPAGFEKDLASALPSSHSITLSGDTRLIDGGFVLKYGDIEQNCSFSAIFDAQREEFADMVREILFA